MLLGMGIWGIILAHQAGQGSRLTLDQALSIAEKNSYELRLAQIVVDKTRAQIDLAKGQALPQFSASGNVSYSDSPLFISGSSFGSGGSGGGGAATGFGNSHLGETGVLSLGMPIDISGNLKRGIDAARAATQSATEAARYQKSEVDNAVRKAFFSTLQTSELVKVYSDTVSADQTRVDNAKKMLDAGSIAPVDLTRVETTLKQSQTNLLTAQNNARLAKLSLNNAMSRPVETPVDPVGVDTIAAPKRTEDAMVESAWVLRPDLRSLAYTAIELQKVREVAQHGLNPTLSLSASSNHNFESNLESYSIGTLSVNVPLWDSGITRAKTRAARADEETVKTQIDQLRLNISLQVREALGNLQNAQSRLDVAKSQVDLAQEAYQIAQLRYSTGAGIELEVDDAETSLTTARANWVNARYDYLGAYADLQLAIGVDDVDTVTMIDALSPLKLQAHKGRKG